MRLALATLLAALLAGGAVAQEPVTPEAFEAMAEGRTLHFTLEDGRPFGSEQYLSGRRVLWQFAGGECQSGAWRAVGELICFSYDGDPVEKCWTLRTEAGRLSAELEGPEGLRLEMSHADERPLSCPGPGVGA